MQNRSLIEKILYSEDPLKRGLVFDILMKEHQDAFISEDQFNTSKVSAYTLGWDLILRTLPKYLKRLRGIHKEAKSVFSLATLGQKDIYKYAFSSRGAKSEDTILPFCFEGSESPISIQLKKPEVSTAISDEGTLVFFTMALRARGGIEIVSDFYIRGDFLPYVPKLLVQENVTITIVREFSDEFVQRPVILLDKLKVYSKILVAAITVEKFDVIGVTGFEPRLELGPDLSKLAYTAKTTVESTFLMGSFLAYQDYMEALLLRRSSALLTAIEEVYLKLADIPKFYSA